VEISEHISSGHIHTGDRLRCNDHPAHLRRRLVYRIQNTFLKELGICEEQGSIPAEKDQAGYMARVRIAGDIVVPLNSLCSAQHC
jgi:hypothetical protein